MSQQTTPLRSQGGWRLFRCSDRRGDACQTQDGQDLKKIVFKRDGKGSDIKVVQGTTGSDRLKRSTGAFYLRLRQKCHFAYHHRHLVQQPVDTVKSKICDANQTDIWKYQSNSQTIAPLRVGNTGFMATTGSLVIPLSMVRTQPVASRRFSLRRSVFQDPPDR